MITVDLSYVGQTFDWMTSTVPGKVMWALCGWSIIVAWIYFVFKKCLVSDLILALIFGALAGPLMILVVIFALLLMLAVNHNKVIWRRKQ